MSLAWIALVLMAAKTARLRPVLKPLAAAGRMAFSNYILETVVCTWIFYGHGLGLFARVSRVEEAAVVPGVWAVPAR